MIRATLFIVCICNSFISQSQIPELNDPIRHPYLTNKYQVDSIDGIPISYYLEHPKIDQYSKLFYKGEFAVSDDTLTFKMLHNLNTENADIRPFYLFIDNQIVNLADGALAEAIGSHTLTYLKSYTCEFFELSKEFSISYKKWADYSAYELYFAEEPFESQKGTAKKILDNVRNACPNFINDAERVNSYMNQFLIANHE